MNERIFELGRQATIWCCENVGHDNQVEWDHMWEQKFAELLIRECARVDSEENNPDHIDGETYNQTILRHFGVEE